MKSVYPLPTGTVREESSREESSRDSPLRSGPDPVACGGPKSTTVPTLHSPCQLNLIDRFYVRDREEVRTSPTRAVAAYGKDADVHRVIP